jgi:hypothetical protein
MGGRSLRRGPKPRSTFFRRMAYLAGSYYRARMAYAVALHRFDDAIDASPDPNDDDAVSWAEDALGRAESVMDNILDTAIRGARNRRHQPRRKAG